MIKLVAAPMNKLVVNSPFCDKQVYTIRVINDGTSRIGYKALVKGAERISVSPATGVLDGKEQLNIDVTVQPFNLGSSNVAEDRITFSYVATPDGCAKSYREDWFKGDISQSKLHLRVEYNP